MVRGQGVTSTRNWAWTKEYKKYSSRILLQKNIIFNSIFDINKILKLEKTDIPIYENIVKVKKILDVIDAKSYKKYFEK